MEPVNFTPSLKVPVKVASTANFPGLSQTLTSLKPSLEKGDILNRKLLYPRCLGKTSTCKGIFRKTKTCVFFIFWVSWPQLFKIVFMDLGSAWVGVAPQKKIA